MRAVLTLLQSPSVAMRVPQLFDVFSRTIETNLTREQILGLARLFHQVRPETVVGDALPGRRRPSTGATFDGSRAREDCAMLVPWTTCL